MVNRIKKSYNRVHGFIRDKITGEIKFKESAVVIMESIKEYLEPLPSCPLKIEIMAMIKKFISKSKEK